MTVLTTSLSTKGQLILPKTVRDELRWTAGTRLTVQQTADGVLLAPLRAPFAPTSLDDVFGCLRQGGRQAGAPKTVEDMQQGLLDEARRRHSRGDRASD